MNRAERRARARWSPPPGCRAFPGEFFEDGQAVFAYTVSDGGALLHDHATGACTLTPETAEVYYQAKGGAAGCACCAQDHE